MLVMLKHLSPLLTPELLHGLACMGHGDDVAVVDANFPAYRIARMAGVNCIQLPGLSSSEVLGAILQVLPLDDFEDHCAWTMQVVGDAAQTPEAVAEFKELIATHSAQPLHSLERFAFYRQAQSASLVVQTGDLRKYANVLLRKGVISTD